MVVGRQLVEHLTGEASADAGGRHDAAQLFADEHVLGMQLDEIINVSIARPVFEHGQFQSEDRHLGHIVAAGNKIIIDLEHQRMDDVLGVMDGDNFVFARARNFVEPHATVNPIQTIGFAGWSFMGDDDFVNPRIDGADFVHAPGGFGVVGINADEEIVFFVEDNPGGELGHFVDNTAFLPGGDAQGDPLLGRQAQLLEGDVAPLAGAPQIKQEMRVEEQIIQATNEKADGGEVSQRQEDLLQDRHYHLAPRDRPTRKSSYCPAAPSRVWRSSRPR